MKPPIIIRGHLGLGDHLITNALVRDYARDHEAVFVPCKPHNFTTVKFMFSDQPNIVTIPVMDDLGADETVKAFAGERLKLGMFGEKFSYKAWDKVMYDQAGVGFSTRWSGFRARRSSNMVKPPTNSPYIFVHEDTSRDFVINRDDVPVMWEVSPEKTETIFDWVEVIENAIEIHCIDSSFAILVDSLENLKAKVLKLHLYARPGANPPHYKKKWEIIR